ncbi:MAG TPA: TRAP transporter substrate-binding protein [Steroidobacteraceae bacterium]|jgi:TRAP-type mannitol/chloroaromatic compound transport system substrate-binding protein|nr:TRAP transporter substrate-binding protein [Steroidobacteraceae bacterium]
MNRRHFITKAGMLAGGTALGAPLATPAVARSAPEIKWRLTSSFPKSVDTIYGSADVISKLVSDLTGGKFQIQVFPSGELIPGLQALDAVQNNTVEACHTVSYYYVGKDPTFSLGGSIPFGLNARQQNAWLYAGGGEALLNNFFANYNVVYAAGGNTGTQMGGWFRSEIKSVADLNGLKMRIAGLAGRVVERLGVVPQQIAAGDIYSSLERGTIDATEWVGPYDDEKLGFYQVAKYYYYPAFWEGGPTICFFFNKAKYDELPSEYKNALDVACKVANQNMLVQYDVKNTQAIRRLVGKGVQLRPMPRDVLDASYIEAFKLYAELSATNEHWKKIYEPWKVFRDETYQWFRTAEYTFDSYVYTQQARGK